MRFQGSKWLMTRLLLIGMVLGALCLNAAENPALAYEKEIRPLLDTYCFKCHGESKAKGGVNLHAYKDLTFGLQGSQNLADGHDPNAGPEHATGKKTAAYRGRIREDDSVAGQGF